MKYSQIDNTHNLSKFATVPTAAESRARSHCNYFCWQIAAGTMPTLKLVFVGYQIQIKPSVIRHIYSFPIVNLPPPCLAPLRQPASR